MREPGLHIVVYVLRRQVKKQLNYFTQLTQIVYQIPEIYDCEKQPQNVCCTMSYVKSARRQPSNSNAVSNLELFSLSSKDV